MLLFLSFILISPPTILPNTIPSSPCFFVSFSFSFPSFSFAPPSFSFSSFPSSPCFFLFLPFFSLLFLVPFFFFPSLSFPFSSFPSFLLSPSSFLGNWSISVTSLVAPLPRYFVFLSPDKGFNCLTLALPLYSPWQTTLSW